AGVVHARAVGGQQRRRGVENTAQNEAAARRYSDDLLFVIGGAALRQRSKPGPFQLDALGGVGIPPTDALVDEAAVGMGMLETRECQSEVIEPMRQRDAGNRDRA